MLSKCFARHESKMSTLLWLQLQCKPHQVASIGLIDKVGAARESEFLWGTARGKGLCSGARELSCRLKVVISLTKGHSGFWAHTELHLLPLEVSVLLMWPPALLFGVFCHLRPGPLTWIFELLLLHWYLIQNPINCLSIFVCGGQKYRGLIGELLFFLPERVSYNCVSEEVKHNLLFETQKEFREE